MSPSVEPQHSGDPRGRARAVHAAEDLRRGGLHGDTRLRGDRGADGRGGPDGRHHLARGRHRGSRPAGSSSRSRPRACVGAQRLQQGVRRDGCPAGLARVTIWGNTDSEPSEVLVQVAALDSLTGEPRRLRRCSHDGSRGRTSHLDIEPDDTEIVARVCAGDTDAYAHLVDRHAPMAIRTAAVLGAGADAEDVVQEAFVKAYAALGRLRPGAPFRPWFLRIVANETRNLHRAAGRGRRGSDAPGSGPSLGARTARRPGRRVLAAERHASLARGLAQLSRPHREVVSCRYLLDLDEAETAAVLGWPRGTVKSRLHRALRRLQANLDARHDDDAREPTHRELTTTYDRLVDDLTQLGHDIPVPPPSPTLATAVLARVAALPVPGHLPDAGAWYGDLADAGRPLATRASPSPSWPCWSRCSRRLRSGRRWRTGSASPESSSSVAPSTRGRCPATAARRRRGMTVAQAADAGRFHPARAHRARRAGRRRGLAGPRVRLDELVHRRRARAPRPVRRPARLPDRQDLPGCPVRLRGRGSTPCGSRNRTRW